MKNTTFLFTCLNQLKMNKKPKSVKFACVKASHAWTKLNSQLGHLPRRYKH